MLLKHGAPVSLVWNLYYLAPIIRKQVNARFDGSIHDTCMKHVYAQLKYIRHVTFRICIFLVTLHIRKNTVELLQDCG